MMYLEQTMEKTMEPIMLQILEQTMEHILLQTMEQIMQPNFLLAWLHYDPSHKVVDFMV